MQDNQPNATRRTDREGKQSLYYDPESRLHLDESPSSNALSCYFEEDVPNRTTRYFSWRDHPVLDLIRTYQTLRMFSVGSPSWQVVNDLSPVIVAISEKSTLQSLQLTLSWSSRCSTVALERLCFHPTLEKIVLRLTQRNVDENGHECHQELLRTIVQIVETCPSIQNVTFMQCDFTAQTWMPLGAALCQVQAPEVTLGLIDCKFDDEAFHQFKVFLHECPKPVHLFTDASQDWFPPSQPSRLLPLLGPCVRDLKILMLRFDSGEYRYRLAVNWDSQPLIEETMSFLGKNVHNLSIQELTFGSLRHSNDYHAVVSRIPSLYGVGSLVVTPSIIGEQTDWQAFEENKQSVLAALDKNCTIQKFEVKGYPWSDHDVHVLESILHRNACISCWIASSPDEIPYTGLWPHVLFRIMQKSPIQTTIIYEALRTLNPMTATIDIWKNYEQNL